MKLSTCISLVAASMAVAAERAPLRFLHVHPRQYYAPPPSYSPPVPSSTFDNFPPSTLSFPAIGIPSSTGVSLSSNPVNTTLPASSGLWNSTIIRSTVIVTSQVVITATPPALPVPVVTSTKLVTTTSCRLNNEGVIICNDIFPSSTITPTTFGTFTDGTATSFPVNTPTSFFRPPISFSLSTGVSLSTRVSLSTGPFSSYLTSTTPPYGNGTSSTYSWGTGTAPTPFPIFSSPSKATTSSGYYIPGISASTPNWNQKSSVPTDTRTGPTDTSPTPSSSSSYTYTWPLYSYSYSSYTPPASGSSNLTTPTTSSSYTSVPDVPSSITFEFPSSFSFSFFTPSYSSPSSGSTSRSTLTSARSSLSSSSPAITFPPWPPVFTPTTTRTSSSTLYTSGRSSSSVGGTTSTLPDSVPTSFNSSTKSYYAPPPTQTGTFTDGTFSSWPIDTPTSSLSLTLLPSESESYGPSTTPTGTYTDATNSSWDVPTPTPSTFQTSTRPSSSSAKESETGGYYVPPSPTGTIREDSEMSVMHNKAVGKDMSTMKRQRGSTGPKMTEDGVAKMNNAKMEAKSEAEMGEIGMVMEAPKPKKEPMMWFM